MYIYIYIYIAVRPIREESELRGVRSKQLLASEG